MAYSTSAIAVSSEYVLKIFTKESVMLSMLSMVVEDMKGAEGELLRYIEKGYSSNEC